MLNSNSQFTIRLRLNAETQESLMLDPGFTHGLLPEEEQMLIARVLEDMGEESRSHHALVINAEIMQ